MGGRIRPAVKATVDPSDPALLTAITAAVGSAPGGGAAPGVAKVAVWSDSMGEQQASDGRALYTVLAAALGVETFDGADPGWTSTEVAIRQGGLDLFVTLPGNTIPAGTGQVTVTVQPAGVYSATSLNIAGSLAGVPGNLGKTPAGQWLWNRTTAGAAVPVGPEIRFRSADGPPRADWVQVLWSGRNNTPDPGSAADTLVRDVMAMRNALTPAVPRFLVLPVLNGTGSPTANARLAAEFGPNFYDLRGWLIRNGLALAGITPTAADTTAVNAGEVPPSLLTDGTHLTATGRTLVGNRLAELMVARGWFPAFTPVALPGAGTPALTNTTAPAITGTAAVGATLTSSTGAWSATPDGYTYQWRRNGAAITGATAATYVVTSTDQGTTLTVAVTASKAGYTPGSAVSAGTAIPAAAAGPTVTNLAVNPRGGTNTANWAPTNGGGSAALTAVATGGPVADAPSFLRQTWSTAATGMVQNVHTAPIAPSATYRVSYYVRPSFAGAKIQLQVGWFNSGAYVNAATPVSGTALPQGAWTRVDATVTAPAGCNQIKVFANTATGDGSTLPGVGDTWDVSGVLVTAGSTLYPYRDGDSAGWAWTGTAHASTSTGPMPA